MTVAYLVDTDWVIHYLHGHPGITQRLQHVQSEGLGLSIIAVAELYEGVYYSTDPSGNQQALLEFLRGVTVLGVDEETAKAFGLHRGRLRAAGTSIGDFDLLIGVTALHHGLTLLSNNRRHFERITGLNLESI